MFRKPWNRKNADVQGSFYAKKILFSFSLSSIKKQTIVMSNGLLPL